MCCLVVYWVFFSYLASFCVVSTQLVHLTANYSAIDFAYFDLSELKELKRSLA
uniref:Uncharacterized protein n=1 Tax=Anguilla anguilla TaxID=7936 RepID=A0A0E9UXL5_ANGAN